MAFCGSMSDPAGKINTASFISSPSIFLYLTVFASLGATSALLALFFHVVL